MEQSSKLTVAWLSGQRWVMGSGDRLSEQATSKTCSLGSPFSTHPLMIWRRCNQLDWGSRAAKTRSCGGKCWLSSFKLAACWVSTSPMGTPLWYARLTQSASASIVVSYVNPANILTVMRGPEVAKVSRRCMASKIPARVLVSAQTPAKPAEPWVACLGVQKSFQLSIASPGWWPG